MPDSSRLGLEPDRGAVRKHLSRQTCLGLDAGGLPLYDASVWSHISPSGLVRGIWNEEVNGFPCVGVRRLMLYWVVGGRAGSTARASPEGAGGRPTPAPRRTASHALSDCHVRRPAAAGNLLSGRTAASRGRRGGGAVSSICPADTGTRAAAPEAYPGAQGPAGRHYPAAAGPAPPPPTTRLRSPPSPRTCCRSPRPTWASWAFL